MHLTSCNLAPKYQKPLSPIDLKEDKNLTKISKLSWKQYFKSKNLRQIIQMTLDNNKDLRVSYLNIKAARQNHKAANASLLPNINAQGSFLRRGVPSAFAAFVPDRSYDSNIALSAYEIDFFGKLRNLKKIALQDLLISDQDFLTIRLSLIAQTANAYVQYLVNKEHLKISQKIIEAYQLQYDLVEIRHQEGIIDKTSLLLASSALENAKINHENYQKLLIEAKNNLMLLTATNNEDLLALDYDLDNLIIEESGLKNTPSKSLLFRPDIRKAELKLISANANIGAARAAFFPSITLSANAGYGSQKSSSLFSSQSWNYNPQINLPIFAGGANKANLDLAKIRKHIEIANYEKVIRTAFSEAKDALQNQKTSRTQLNLSDAILTNRLEIYKISQQEQKSGLIDAHTLANFEIEYLKAQHQELQSRNNYIISLINLYKILGGGTEFESKKDKS